MAETSPVKTIEHRVGRLEGDVESIRQSVAEIKETINTGFERLFREQGKIEREARSEVDTLARKFDEAMHRPKQWAPIAILCAMAGTLVTVAVAVLTFGLGIYINLSNETTRNAIADARSDADRSRAAMASAMENAIAAVNLQIQEVRDDQDEMRKFGIETRTDMLSRTVYNQGIRAEGSKWEAEWRRLTDSRIDAIERKQP